jgi:uncharacterized membrane protein
MMKPSKKGIASILLIIFSFLISYSTPSGFSLGDKLFELVGLPVWSNGQDGFHYPVIPALCLLIIGIVWVVREFGGWRILVLIILCLLLSHGAVSMSETIYYKAHSGLWAVDYDPENSQIDYASDKDGKTLSVSGQLDLINYGSRPVTFGIKALDDSTPQEGLFPKEMVLQDEAGAKKSEQFTLEPGAGGLNVQADIPLAGANFQDVRGGLTGPDLVLFNSSGTRIVGRNR